jgi:ribosomal protein L7/L12
MSHAPRYVVRRTKDERRYSVWDNDTGKVAVLKYRECTDLGFEDAFRIVDSLSAMEEPPEGK